MGCKKCSEKTKVTIGETKHKGSSAVDRMQVCMLCEHYTKVMSLKKCGMCGCFLSIKTLIGWASCPDGKW